MPFSRKLIPNQGKTATKRRRRYTYKVQTTLTGPHPQPQLWRLCFGCDWSRSRHRDEQSIGCVWSARGFGAPLLRTHIAAKQRLPWTHLQTIVGCCTAYLALYPIRPGPRLSQGRRSPAQVADASMHWYTSICPVIIRCSTPSTTATILTGLGNNPNRPV